MTGGTAEDTSSFAGTGEATSSCFGKRTPAQSNGTEEQLDVKGQVMLRSVLDSLETQYPMLRGAIRDHVTKRRRPFIRFFACEQDVSHEATDTPSPRQS